MFKEWWRNKRPKIIGAIVWGLARLVGKTLRLKVDNWQVVQEQIEKGKGAVLLTWHGRTFIPANFFVGKDVWALISLSHDGDIMNVIFQRFGFKTIRGSTRHGGVRAALEAARKVKQGAILAFTPDGPRGPNKKVQAGALLIAQKSGCPIIPAGCAAKPYKLLPTWDQYMIPSPFARARFIFGEPIMIPADADEAALSQLTEQIEQAINVLEQEAERI